MIGNPIRLLSRTFILLVVFGTAVFAQLPSAATLKGSYYVRYLGEDKRNGAAISSQGTMLFDGAGAFTITGQGASSKTTDNLLKTLASCRYSPLSNGSASRANPSHPA